MRVRCVDAHGTRLLTEGREYKAILADPLGFYGLALVPGVWSASRFEVVTP